MTRIDLHESSKLTFVEGAAPSTPASGLVLIYAKSDGNLYQKDDVGAETVLAGGGGGGGLSSGSSFPGSPSTGDRFRRTDLAYQVFYYDGTRWLTEQIHAIPLFQMPDDFTSQKNMAATGVSGTPATISRSGSWVGLGDLWLIDWIQHTRVLTTNNGTNYWTMTLSKFTQAVSQTTIDSFNTSAHTAGDMVTTVRTIGALIGTSNTTLQVQGAKTLSPGNLVSDGGVVRFRIVAT